MSDPDLSSCRPLYRTQRALLILALILAFTGLALSLWVSIADPRPGVSSFDISSLALEQRHL